MTQPMAERVCGRCGVTFTTPLYRVGDNRGRYCSMACRYPARVPRTCARCGRTFQARPNQVQVGRALYCSRACLHKPLSEVGERFWPRVDRSGDCWPWTGPCNLTGHGRTHIGKKHHAAHRLAWELTHGPIPAGLVVRHTCDNPPCCNPAHLLLGTVKDNSRDMSERGRSVRGERNHRTKLTAEQVQAIRARYATGEVSYGRLAREYGLSKAGVYNIVQRQVWAHVG